MPVGIKDFQKDLKKIDNDLSDIYEDIFYFKMLIQLIIYCTKAHSPFNGESFKQCVYNIGLKQVHVCEYE